MFGTPTTILLAVLDQSPLCLGGPIPCSMDPPMDAVGAVVADWKSNENLVLLAAGGIMAKVGNHSDLDRDELDSNKDVLVPIVRHLGFLASINFTQASVISWMFVVPGVTFHLIIHVFQGSQVST